MATTGPGKSRRDRVIERERERAAGERNPKHAFRDELSDTMIAELRASRKVNERMVGSMDEVKHLLVRIVEILGLAEQERHMKRQIQDLTLEIEGLERTKAAVGRR